MQEWYFFPKLAAETAFDTASNVGSMVQRNRTIPQEAAIQSFRRRNGHDGPERHGYQQ
jgi:hypothetical protein